jgi:AcrR family transcriptional regulator
VNASQRGRPASPEKRQAMIAAAMRLFGAKGVDATTTREIAAMAETTERTLFKHFGSKQGLVQAAIDQVSFVAMRQQAYARITSEAPFTAQEFVEWHRAFLWDRVETAQAVPETYAVLFRELFRDGQFRADYAQRWLGGVFAPLAGHLEDMQARGEVTSRQSPAALASAFFSMSIGYLVSRFVLMPGFPWDDHANIESLVAMFRAICSDSNSLS